MKLDEKALAEYFGSRGCFTKTVPAQPLVLVFGIGDILWELAWLLQDQAVPLELATIKPEAIWATDDLTELCELQTVKVVWRLIFYFREKSWRNEFLVM